MTNREFACRSCGAGVPTGRLACPTCGELLASVSAPLPVGRPWVGETGGAASGPGLAEPAASEPGSAADPPGRAREPDNSAPPWGGRRPDPLPWESGGSGTAGDRPQDPGMWTAGEPAGSISAGFVRDGRPGHANGADPNPLDREVPAGDRSAAAEDRETLRAEFIAGPPIPPTAAFLPGATFAGALRDVEPLPAGRLGPPEGWQSPAAAAARWADLTGTIPGTGSAGDAAGGTTAGGGSRSAGSVADRLRGLRPGIGFTVSRELTERLVGIAAGIVAAAFLLPWGPIVIGAPSLGTPWISLGVLGSGNLVVLLLALGVVGLALAVRVVPDWLRLGVAPLALGALALGVSWPYLMGPIGGGPGVPVLAFGALVCAVVGLAGIWRAVGSDDAPSG